MNGTLLEGVKPISTIKKPEKTNLWTTEKVNQWLYNYENGYDQDMPSPFMQGKIGFRKGNLNYRCTSEEVEEIRKCATDIVYFANKYCYAMTDEGIKKVTLYDFQRKILKEFQDYRFNIFLASRQIGKTITSAFFIMWYMCFHVERNCLIVANKGKTMKEIIDKTKIVYENLPFFLKPGILVDNVESLRFDNGCRLFGQATSKTPGLGFTIHLLYADEFAHIPANIIKSFYRSVFPTLSSSKVSKIIITSTPNGLNKFYEIYNSAIEGENSYHPIRVDYDAVKGRDEAWKQKEIANLGSEEEFNQEYGNQFINSSKMALDRYTINKLTRIQEEYIWERIEEFEEEGLDYQNLKWRKSFIKDVGINDNDKFIISIDISDGVKKDFSVLNIFKFEPLSLAKIRTIKKFEDESDFFKLTQVGLFRDNGISIDDLSKILDILVFDIFGEENVKITLEMNHKGELVVHQLEKNDEYFPELFIHTKHSLKAKESSLGIRYNKANKPIMVSEMSYYIRNNRICINEKNSVFEAVNFGINPKGGYCSQIGNDDIIMSCVNLAAFFKSYDMYDMIEDIMDEIDQEKYDNIYYKLDTKRDD